MYKIDKLEKDDSRKDISNYVATLEDGSTIGIEAKSAEEAREKLAEHYEATRQLAQGN